MIANSCATQASTKSEEEFDLARVLAEAACDVGGCEPLVGKVVDAAGEGVDLRGWLAFFDVLRWRLGRAFGFVPRGVFGGLDRGEELLEAFGGRFGSVGLLVEALAQKVRELAAVVHHAFEVGALRVESGGGGDVIGRGARLAAEEDHGDDEAEAAEGEEDADDLPECERCGEDGQGVRERGSEGVDGVA